MNNTPTDSPIAAGPRYCPRCLGDGPGQGPLCPNCGEKLRPRGYCEICEDHWKQDPGSDCPKHDVMLVLKVVRSMSSFGEAGEKVKLVTVATYSHPNQATGPRIRLEAEGIPTFLDGERIAANTLYQVATGGVRLQVPAPLASAARIMIDQTWALPPDDDEIDGFDDEDEGDDLEDQAIAEPETEVEPWDRRRAVMQVAIFLFLFGPPVILLIGFLIRGR